MPPLPLFNKNQNPPRPEHCLAEEVHDLRVGHAQREVAVGFAPAGLAIGRITAQREVVGLATIVDTVFEAFARVRIARGITYGEAQESRSEPSCLNQNQWLKD